MDKGTIYNIITESEGEKLLQTIAVIDGGWEDDLFYTEYDADFLFDTNEEVEALREGDLLGDGYIFLSIENKC